jgi:hypothetical protein
MLRRLHICICLFLALLSLKNYAQEIAPNDDSDTKYREDQFYIGITYNLLSDVPDGVKIRGLSGGIQFGFLRDMPINKRRNLAIAVGAGLAFNEYGQLLFIGEAPDGKTIFTVLNDQNVDFTRNRFSTSTIEAPIEFRWRSSTPDIYKFWRVYVGFKLGYAFWYKSTFKQPGNNVTQTDIPEFEKVLGIQFHQFKKADSKSIEENNGLLWAKKIFKTKPNHEVSQDFKAQIKTIFHHLTKEELVDKILANYLVQIASIKTKPEALKKKKKK